MPTYRMHLVYDGAPFHGFARQPDVPTVQGLVEDSLSRVLGEAIQVSVAGRTDAGVHALGQVTSFVTQVRADLGEILRRLNQMWGPEVAALSLAEAPEGFDARFSAISRSYEYAIFTRDVHDPFSRHTTWHHPGTLDVPAMRKAAQAFVGEYDFTSFGRVAEGRPPVRRVESVEVSEEEDLILISVTAGSFIQQMVRSIVGTLVGVGEGKIDAGSIPRILEARDRSAAGPVAPPHGLFLISVTYPEELL